MPLMNTHQMLGPMARRPGLWDTYVTSLVTKKPTVTVEGSVITFAEGQMEFDGIRYPMEGMVDFSAFVSILPKPPLGQTTVDACYNVYAVPKYFEPSSRFDAENPDNPYAAAGVNYFVTHEGRESYLQYFFPSHIEEMVKSAGGLEYLEDAMAKGYATGQEQRIFNLYQEAYNQFNNGSFIGKDLMPVGTEFILARVSPSPTVPDPDATDQMTQSEFRYFISSQSGAPAKSHFDTYTLTSATSGTFFTGPTQPGYTIPGEKIWKMKTIVLYPTLEDANANTNAFPISYPSGQQSITEAYNYVTAPAPDGLGWPTTLYAMVWEYYVPSYLPPGQIGTHPQIHQFLTKMDHISLGRVNPIYLAELFQVPRICSGMSRRSALMDYACPAILIRVCATITAGDPPTVALNSAFLELYQTYP